MKKMNIDNIIIAVIVILIMIVSGTILFNRHQRNNDILVSSVDNQNIKLSLNNSFVIDIEKKEKISNIQWSAEDNNILEVEGTNENCYIKGVNLGETKLTLSYFDSDNKNYIKEYHVSVIPGNKDITNLDLKSGSIVLSVADEYQLVPVLQPTNAKNVGLNYITEDPTIANIDNETGLIHAVKKGKTQVRVYNEKFEKSIDVYVVDYPVSAKIAIIPEKIIFTDIGTEIEVGSNVELGYTVSPQNASVDIINWDSDIEGMYVSSGYVRGLQEGTGTVTASFGDLLASTGVVIKSDPNALNNTYGLFTFTTLTMDNNVSKTIYDTTALADANRFTNNDEYFTVSYSTQLNNGEKVKYCVYDTSLYMTCGPNVDYDITTSPQVIMTDATNANHVTGVRIAVLDSDDTIIAATDKTVYFYYLQENTDTGGGYSGGYTKKNTLHCCGSDNAAKEIKTGYSKCEKYDSNLKEATLCSDKRTYACGVENCESAVDCCVNGVTQSMDKKTCENASLGNQGIYMGKCKSESEYACFCTPDHKDCLWLPAAGTKYTEKDDSITNSSDCNKITSPENVKCSRGEYKRNGSCVKCPSGYTSAGGSADTVTDCYMNVPAGNFLPYPTASNYISCTEGYYQSSTKRVSYGNSNSCIKCEDGVTNAKLGATQCTKVEDNKTSCPSGQYLSNGTCKACPSGYTSLSANKKGITDCYMRVPAGKFLPYPTSSTTSYCPKGTYSSSAVTLNYGQSNTCSPCNGTTNKELGATICKTEPDKIACYAYDKTLNKCVYQGVIITKEECKSKFGGSTLAECRSNLLTQ